MHIPVVTSATAAACYIAYTSSNSQQAQTSSNQMRVEREIERKELKWNEIKKQKNIYT